MLKEESHLVKNLAKGNLLAFNTLFKEYSNRLFRFAYGYLKSEAEAEELVQEVFARIWENRKALNDELSFKAYVFTISFNIIKKNFRTKAYLEKYFRSKIYNEEDMETSQKISYDSLLQYIKELATKLPERRREIFMRSRFEGQKIQEIAEAMKISHKTVENQLTEALKFIRDNLKKEEIAILLFASLFIL